MLCWRLRLSRSSSTSGKCMHFIDETYELHCDSALCPLFFLSKHPLQWLRKQKQSTNPSDIEINIILCGVLSIFCYFFCRFSLSASIRYLNTSTYHISLKSTLYVSLIELLSSNDLKSNGFFV